MNYEFPKIEHIDDVLPHIEGREEFVVAPREFGTVINYNVVMPDTFPPIEVAGGSAKMCKERSLTNRIRRECRGLIFYPNGRLMSRPFHKFFNIGERDETHINQIDITAPHVIMEKMDGCLHKDTELLCEDGDYRTIKDVIENKINVRGIDVSGEITTAIFIEGLVTESEKEWVEIVTEDGIIYCTSDHKFLTTEGYVEAKNLSGLEIIEV